MKTFMPLIALSLVSTAAAQTILPANQSFVSGQRVTMTLIGCVREDATTVRCEYTMLRNGKDENTSQIASNYTVITADGREFKGSQIRVGVNSSWVDSQYFTARSGIKYPLSVRFRGLPANLTTLHYLDTYVTATEETFGTSTGRMLSVPIKGATPAATPAVTPAPAASLNYTALLTNCKPGAAGTLTCTATLTPRK